MRIKQYLFNCLLFNCLFRIVVLFIAFSIPAYAEDGLTSHPSGIVSQCFDGDTVKLNDRRVVRLAGIDAPEVAHQDRKAQYYARQAKKIIERLSKGREIYLKFPGEKQHDRYQRLVAEILLPDGKSLNESLVEQGAAFVYPHADLSNEFIDRLLKLQAEAIKDRRGMWNKILSLPLAGDTYIGNRQSLRFFPENCVAAQRLKPRNRVHFGNLMDAFLAGYAPARICPFWPEE